MKNVSRFAAITVAVLLFASACSNDDGDTASTTTTTEKATTTTSTTTVPGATVEYLFVEAASSEDAEQAATVMEQRLAAAGYEGSTADVNADGTGLEIKVATTTSSAQATEIVDPLTITGALFFRHVLEVLAPAPGDPPSQYTDAALGLPGEETADAQSTVPSSTDAPTTTTTTTLPGADVASTPPDQDDPNGESVLLQRDDTGGVVQRFRVAPQQLTGTAIAGAESTQLNGNWAVKMELTEGAQGIDGFNSMAAQCNPPTGACPETGPGGVGRIAIVLDSEVSSAPSVRPGEPFRPFSADGIYITAEWLTEVGSQTLAVVLAVGALPVGLQPV